MFAGRTLLRSLLAGVAAMAVLAPASAALAEPTPAEIQKQINDGNNALELVVESYNKINGELATTQAALTDLAAKMPPLQANMDAAASNVDEIARLAYERGTGMRALSLLLSASSTGTFVDQLATLQQISRTQQRQIDAYTEARKTFDTEKKRLDDLLALQTGQRNELVAKKAKIEGDIARLDEMQRRVNASTGTTGTGTTVPRGTPPAVSGAAGKVVDFAWAQLGEKYVYGAAGPDTWDCSGLTMMAWKAGGKSLPHNAADQHGIVKSVTRAQLAAGDLVFYNSLGHVGIYIGNNQIIHAPNSRTVVKVAPIDVDSIVSYGRP